MNLIFFTNKYIRIFLEFISWIIYTIKDLFYKHEKLPPIEDELLVQPATTLARKIRQQEITSEEVVKAFIKRNKDIHPHINALIQNRFEEAIKEAMEADKYVRENPNAAKDLEETKPFLGVPFTLKDAYSIAGLPHTTGIFKRKDLIAKEDADCAKMMKKTGAICLGVTNVPEACFWWESNNTIYGRTNNPYDYSRVPGGSSGGEGSLIGAAGSVMGIGSDLGGSIRLPSFFCGIFGHKTTPGIVSCVGHKPAPPPLSHTDYSVTGPMCRYATDIKPMLKAMAGDNAEQLNLDDPVDLKKVKIYYMLDVGPNSDATVKVDPEITTGLLMTANYLKSKLNLSVEKVFIPEFQKGADILYSILWKNDMIAQKEISADGKEFSVLPEILKYMSGISVHSAPALYLCLIEQYRESFMKSPRYSAALKTLDQLQIKMKEFLQPNTVLLFPTNPLQAPHHYETLFKPMNLLYTSIVNMLHLPATACPLGLSSKGLPIGIQVIGGHGQDKVCISISEELERAFGGWMPPSEIKC